MLIATLLAYLAAYVVEVALGNSDPSRVGWSASYVPVLVEGFVFGMVTGGIWGVVLAPLSLLLTPETWFRVSRLWALVGPAGLLLLTQPVPALWAAGAVGAATRWLAAWLARR